MVQNISQSANKPQKNNFFLFSQNPVVDAAVWGATGVAGGTLASVIIQKKTFNNQDKFTKAIASTKEQLKNCKSPKSLKKIEHDLYCLNNKKLNYKSMGRLALVTGLICFVPQLIINLCIAGGQKAYDKVKNNKT